MPTTHTLTLALLAAVCGCSDRAATPLTLDDLPLLDLTEEQQIARVDDPDIGFSYIATVDVADDGTVYVVDAREAHVRVFDSTGAFIRTIGRSGQGPGEFGYPEAVGVFGDSIWISDSGNRRISFFSRDGSLISTLFAPVVPVGDPTLAAAVYAALPRRDGTVASLPVLHTYTPMVAIDSATLPRLLFDAKGNVIDTLGWHVRHELRASLFRMGERWIAVRPLQYASHPIEVDSDTLHVVIEQAVLSPTDGRLTIKRVNDRGAARETHIFRYTPRRLDEDVRTATINRFLRSSTRDGVPLPGAREMIRKGLEFPEYLPAVRQGVLGKDGTLWLARGDGPEGEPTRWLVVDPNGVPLGETVLPPGSSAGAMQVIGNRIWIPMQDDSGLLWLARLRIGG